MSTWRESSHIGEAAYVQSTAARNNELYVENRTSSSVPIDGDAPEHQVPDLTTPIIPSEDRCDVPRRTICAHPGCGRPFDPRRGGVAQRYCSPRCRWRAWDEAHPRVSGP